MKRFFAIAAAALLLLSLVSFPASAGSAPARFYLTGPSSASVGDTIDISLMLEGEFAANTLDLRVFFDNTSFKVKNTVIGDALRKAQSLGGFAMADVNMAGNAVSVGVMMITEPMTEPGELVKITLEVIGTASADVDFGVEIREFTYLPIGQTIAENIACSSEGIRISVSGGTGTGTTPIPEVTPKPAGTNPPANVTYPPDDPGKTGTPVGPIATQDPAATGNTIGKQTPNPGDPGVTPSPDGSEAPAGDTTEPPSGEDGTPAPGQSAEPGATEAPSRANDQLKTGLIIGGSLLGAALAAIVVMSVIRSKRRK